MVFRTHRYWLPLLWLLLAAGCSSQQPSDDPTHEELRLLPGRFADELSPVEVVGRKETVTVRADEHLRPDATLATTGWPWKSTGRLPVGPPAGSRKRPPETPAC